MKNISQNFLYELIRGVLRNKELLELCVEHLKYEYLPDKHWKGIWKSILNSYQNTGKITSIGIISEQYKESEEIQSLLSQISKIEPIENSVLIDQLEEYIKDTMSIVLFKNFEDKYNLGDREGARQMMIKGYEKLSLFTLKAPQNHDTVFSGFSERLKDNIRKRDNGQDVKKKVPFSIDELDDKSYGGLDPGDTACLLARSGVGKTKFLRHVGVGSARRGFKVVHFQAEGTKEKALEGYDATWTGQRIFDLRSGNIDQETLDKIEESRRNINHWGGEIYVSAFEHFDTANIQDIQNKLFDIEKSIGQIDLILIDYLELFNPNDGIRYKVSEERFRRMAIANKFKNLALGFNKSRLITATQANDIPVTDWNNPDWIMTRHNVSEAKALPNSFSFFLTANQTRDEYQAGIMRIYTDKLRDYKAHNIIKIYQNYDRDRFYDRVKTVSTFYKNIDNQ